MKRFIISGTLIFVTLIGILICAQTLFPVEVPIYLDLQKHSLPPQTAPETTAPQKQARSGAGIVSLRSHAGAITISDIANDPRGTVYGIHLQSRHDFLVPGDIELGVIDPGTNTLVEIMNDTRLSGLFNPHRLVIHTGRNTRRAQTTARLISSSGGATVNDIPLPSNGGTENDPIVIPLAPGETQINIVTSDTDNSAMAPVPEPGTLLLFGAGLMCLGLKARKKISIDWKA